MKSLIVTSGQAVCPHDGEQTAVDAAYLQGIFKDFEHGGCQPTLGGPFPPFLIPSFPTVPSFLPFLTPFLPQK